MSAPQITTPAQTDEKPKWNKWVALGIGASLLLLIIVFLALGSSEDKKTVLIVRGDKPVVIQTGGQYTTFEALPVNGRIPTFDISVNTTNFFQKVRPKEKVYLGEPKDIERVYCRHGEEDPFNQFLIRVVLK